MFKHLLVPLDGSRLAEAVLPAAARLSRALDATLTLLHVIERNAPETVHSEPHLADAVQAAAYLERLAARPELAGLRVQKHVHTNEVKDVARSIVAHATELGVDLIALCTHGQGGLRRMLFGTIALRVIAAGSTPVVLVRTGADGAPPAFDCRKFLVPLDGNEAHERGVAAAAELARACKAALYLMACVPTLGTLPGEQAATGLLLPSTMAAVLELSQQQLDEYLRQRVAELQAKGIDVTSEVCRGDPPTTILRTARDTGADLIVLATHGRAGSEAFWAGSVAAKVSARATVPLLLVPIGEADRQASRAA